MGAPDIELESVKVRLFPDGRMTRKGASKYVGLSEKTLAILATKGEGPRYTKRGKVFYYKADLDEWLRKGLVTSTAQARARMR